MDSEPESNDIHVRAKASTGIEGFDEITAGGLPRGRTSLVMGEPGAGKTIFGLQALVHGARECAEPGLFVGFEERVDDVVDNAEPFGWELRQLQQSGQLYFLDAQLSPDTMQNGHFDLAGLLATLEAKAELMGARRIVFDAVDVLLRHLDSPLRQRQEIYRLRNWLAASGMTGILTASLEEGGTSGQPYGLLQAIADCVVQLNSRLENRVALRELRVLKYRGSAFLSNPFPLTIGRQGLDVAASSISTDDYPAYTDRISSGVPRLDHMLGGGFLRGTSILITGAPGTAKSTLAGAFVAAAAARGETSLYVSFDEAASEIVRNLRSVGINLEPYIRSGLLRAYSGRTESQSAEEHLITLKGLLREVKPSCLVIDPLSAAVYAGGQLTAASMAKRLLHMAKSQGITLLCTSLLDSHNPETEASQLQISSLADTWIHLAYVAQDGERNRALTIIKSRGTWHSNQVRELILSNRGVTLADVYTAEGKVLMGTARWLQEQAEARERDRARLEIERKRRELSYAEGEVMARIEALQRELEARRAELTVLEREQLAREQAWRQRVDSLRHLRGDDSLLTNGSDGDNHHSSAVQQPGTAEADRD